MNYNEYFNKLRKRYASCSQEPSGVTRKTYIRLIAKCMSEYNKVNDLRASTPHSVFSGLHAYSRVVTSMAAILNYGKTEDISDIDPALFGDDDGFRELYVSLADRAFSSVEEFLAKDKKGRDPLNFAIRELALSYELSADLVDASSGERWKKVLSAVETNEKYYTHASRTTNRNAYIVGGEALLAKRGIADPAEFIDASLERQFSHFNRLGMYLDNYDKTPDMNPVLYDLTTRVQLQFASGYGGKYSEELNRFLRLGGFVTLFTQSASGEMAYGGRSNQYIFNESLIAANCEFEARHYKEKGDFFLAGVYRRAAHLAVMTSLRWLKVGKHIKNYASDPSVGTEKYGNYDKYMATMSSFLAIAYYFADDSIEEKVCPAEAGGYVFSENENFHITVANACGVSVEIAHHTDPAYDSPGLGRIHFAGSPTGVLLSSPSAPEPNYRLFSSAPKGAGSADVVFEGGSGIFDLHEPEYAVSVIESTPERVVFSVKYEADGGITETYTLDKGGLKICALSDCHKNIGFSFPVLESCGDIKCAPKVYTSLDGNNLRIYSGSFLYKVHSDRRFEKTDRSVSNRNGIYRIFEIIPATDSLSVSICASRVTLETERLILRPWEESDAEELFLYASDPDVGPAAGWMPHKDIEDSRMIIKNILSAPGTFAMVLKSTGKPIGSIGYFPTNAEGASVCDPEIGYWIGKPFWGQGLTPEAVRALIDYCFEKEGASRIFCGYFDGNEKSKRCQEKCGFIFHHTEENVEWKITGETKKINYTCIEQGAF